MTTVRWFWSLRMMSHPSDRLTPTARSETNSRIGVPGRHDPTCRQLVAGNKVTSADTALAPRRRDLRLWHSVSAATHFARDGGATGQQGWRRAGSRERSTPNDHDRPQEDVSRPLHREADTHRRRRPNPPVPDDRRPRRPQHLARVQGRDRGAVSHRYGLRAAVKAETGDAYTVLPLEGLWWVPGEADFDPTDKSNWCWTAMICLPAAVTAAMVVRGDPSGDHQEGSQRRPQSQGGGVHRGTAAQILHIGPYADEAPTIAELHGFIADNGYRLTGKHHEIYLSTNARPNRPRCGPSSASRSLRPDPAEQLASARRRPGRSGRWSVSSPPPRSHGEIWASCCSTFPGIAYRGAAQRHFAVQFPDRSEDLWYSARRWQSRLAPSRPRHSASVNLLMKHMEWGCALYRALREDGVDQAEAGSLVESIMADVYRPVPSVLFKVSRLRSSNYETRVKWLLLRVISRRVFSAPFVHRYLDSDDGVAWDVTCCPFADYFAEQGVPELTPHAALQPRPSSSRRDRRRPRSHADHHRGCRLLRLQMEDPGVSPDRHAEERGR